MNDPIVVLASQSPRRKSLLAQIGLEPVIRPSELEETITTSDPEEAVKQLSLQKAQDIAASCEPGTLVIGADTVVAAGGQILGKPVSHEDAADMIRMLAGHIHQVYTGVTLILKGQEENQIVTFAEKTDVSVYPMTEEEILSYASGDEPMDKAGAYGIQGKFAAFIKKIDGDYSNVVGLPVGSVYQNMKRLMSLEEK